MSTSPDAKKIDRSELANAISGMCGSSISKLFVHPIDTVKAKIQVRKIDFSKSTKSN